MIDTNCPYCDADIKINHDDGYGYTESNTHQQRCYVCEKTFAMLQCAAKENQMTDLERVTRLADDTLIRTNDCDGRLMWEGYPKDLLAFEQAVLAKQNVEMKFCLSLKENAVANRDATYLHLQDAKKEIESLKEKPAMQFDILKRASTSLGAFCSDEGWSQEDMDVLDSVDAFLCADINSCVVDAWIAAHDKELLDEAFELIGYWLPCKDATGSVILDYQDDGYEPLYRRKESK